MATPRGEKIDFRTTRSPFDAPKATWNATQFSTLNMNPTHYAKDSAPPNQRPGVPALLLARVPAPASCPLVLTSHTNGARLAQPAVARHARHSQVRSSAPSTARPT